ncbi:hypothetical protein HYFRA_00006568 [Hymenoscyphus fraxineus]|uniref:Uncharacterized protein n=1 Tax=Hymenoscyphus fraxineus TaxID=746836 RepID=A0A9N9KUF1_9HELO|nr:hypothetical protein HYFRA_00006568 [Hymenoscyphus fraxineus]
MTDSKELSETSTAQKKNLLEPYIEAMKEGLGVGCIVMGPSGDNLIECLNHRWDIIKSSKTDRFCTIQSRASLRTHPLVILDFSLEVEPVSGRKRLMVEFSKISSSTDVGNGHGGEITQIAHPRSGQNDQDSILNYKFENDAKSQPFTKHSMVLLMHCHKVPRDLLSNFRNVKPANLRLDLKSFARLRKRIMAFKPMTVKNSCKQIWIPTRDLLGVPFMANHHEKVVANHLEVLRSQGTTSNTKLYNRRPETSKSVPTASHLVPSGADDEDQNTNLTPPFLEGAFKQSPSGPGHHTDATPKAFVVVNTNIGKETDQPHKDMVHSIKDAIYICLGWKI